MASNALDGNGPLALQLLLVSLLVLCLAVFETGAAMRLQHAMLATEMTSAESTVSDNPLSRVLAVLECAANLLGRSTSQGSR